MDIMPIFAGIVGLVIVVAVAVSAGTMGAIFGVIAEEDEEEEKPAKFQHTATRRWLVRHIIYQPIVYGVSTHSHPKVAAPYIKK